MFMIRQGGLQTIARYNNFLQYSTPGGGGGGRTCIQNVWLRFHTLLYTQFLDKENNEKQEIALRNPGLVQQKS